MSSSELTRKSFHKPFKMLKILKCPKCKKYTMKETCQNCKSSALRATPLKYSNNQIIANIRRNEKENDPEHNNGEEES